MTRITENEIALAVLQIAAGRTNNLCTFNRARNEVHNHVNLGSQDLVQSQTRPREPMWHQLIRNIQSHHDVEGNFICEGFLIHVPRQGYRATAAGLKYLKKLGL